MKETPVTNTLVLQTHLGDGPVRRGQVRDVYGLGDDIVERTRERYIEAFERITGNSFAANGSANGESNDGRPAESGQRNRSLMNIEGDQMQEQGQFFGTKVLADGVIEDAEGRAAGPCLREADSMAEVCRDGVCVMHSDYRNVQNEIEQALLAFGFVKPDINAITMPWRRLWPMPSNMVTRWTTSKESTFGIRSLLTALRSIAATKGKGLLRRMCPTHAPPRTWNVTPAAASYSCVTS